MAITPTPSLFVRESNAGKLPELGFAPSGALNSPLGHAQLAVSNADDDKQKLASNFWSYASVDYTRWNKQYPHQLLVLRKVKGGYQTERKFTMPIPPSELTISTPFAITVSATIGGIVEEHNGAPFKNISASGSFGVAPLKGFGGQPPQTSLSGAIFAGTISAASQLQSNFNNIFDTNTTATPSIMAETSDALKTTGYAQFRLMQSFLETYVQEKTLESGTDLRLAYAMWKDEAIYLVTPLDFSMRRSSASPLEYNYSLQMKAWKRIPLAAAYSVQPEIELAAHSPNKMADILFRLDAAQKTILRLSDLMGATANDVIEVGRKVVLFAKATVGAAYTLADMPPSVSQALRDAILEAASKQGPSRAKNTQKLYEEAGKNWHALGTDALIAAGREAEKQTFGFTQNGTRVGDPVEASFLEPQKYPNLSTNVDLGSVFIAPRGRRMINEEVQKARWMNRNDFEYGRDVLVRSIANIEYNFGTGNTTYAQTMSLPAPTKVREPTNDEWELLFALNEMVMEIDKLCVSGEINHAVRPMEYIAGLASKSGIAFKEPKAKIAIPFPYGSTLEKLAARYLGDPDRWMEIAALNGLREPYVDEEGFTVDIVAPGNGNQITVLSGENLYIGQSVWIVANAVQREKRHIQNIEEISATNVLITLDGESDLSRFTPAGQAKLESFLPDTVNGQMLIFIPSDTAPDENDFQTKDIPGVDTFDPYFRAGGVDWLLTEQGDLAITPDGDVRLAVGMTNLVQRIRTALRTERGSILHHKDYGLGIKKGMSVADMDAKSIVENVKSMFTNDPSFTGVDYAAVRISGGTAALDLSVGIAGTNKSLPLTFDINR